MSKCMQSLNTDVHSQSTVTHTHVTHSSPTGFRSEVWFSFNLINEKNKPTKNYAEIGQWWKFRLHVRRYIPGLWLKISRVFEPKAIKGYRSMTCRRCGDAEVIAAWVNITENIALAPAHLHFHPTYTWSSWIRSLCGIGRDGFM